MEVKVRCFLVREGVPINYLSNPYFSFLLHDAQNLSSLLELGDLGDVLVLLHAYGPKFVLYMHSSCLLNDFLWPYSMTYLLNDFLWPYFLGEVLDRYAILSVLQDFCILLK